MATYCYLLNCTFAFCAWGYTTIFIATPCIHTLSCVFVYIYMLCLCIKVYWRSLTLWVDINLYNQLFQEFWTYTLFLQQFMNLWNTINLWFPFVIQFIIKKHGLTCCLNLDEYDHRVRNRDHRVSKISNSGLHSLRQTKTTNSFNKSIQSAKRLEKNVMQQT